MTLSDPACSQASGAGSSVAAMQAVAAPISPALSAEALESQSHHHKPLIPRLLTSSLRTAAGVNQQQGSGNLDNAPSTASSSKTSAFFSGSPVMPSMTFAADPDASSDRRHGHDPAMTSSLHPKSGRDTPLRVSAYVAHRLGSMSGSGQVSPSPSSASSVRSRRNWDDFEGKPMDALPTPVVGPGETADPVSLGRPAASRGEGSRRSPLRHDDSQPVPVRQGSGDSVSRTLAFFTKGPTPAPPARPPILTTVSANDIHAASSQASRSSGWLSAVEPVQNLPSVPIEDGRALAASPIQNRDTRRSSGSAQPASQDKGDTSMDADTSFASSIPTLPSFESGPTRSALSTRSDSAHHHLDPNAPAIDNVASSSSSSSGENLDTLAPPVTFVSAPAARTAGGRRSSNTRHTHGPSENASGSSLFPSVIRQLRSEIRPDGLPLSSDSPVTSFDSVSAATEPRRQGSPAVSTTSSRQSRASSPASTPMMQSVEALEDEDEDAGIVGPYRVERTLGHGAFSRVVLARISRQRAVAEAKTALDATASHRRTVSESQGRSRPRTAEDEALVALKMMERAPYQQSERMRVSWVREVEVLKHISHPCLVRFIASFSTPRHHVLVLERVGGGELFDLLAKHQLEIARREWLVRRLVAELAGAVGWMHSINLVHRDIKLENIILTRNCFDESVLGGPLTPSLLGPVPLVKITDFGLSRFVDPAGPLLETRCGSEEYAAPELIMGKRYDGRCTDVWALGVVTYALLTGALPFLEDDEVAARGGLDESREGAHVAERDARQRKAHLLRIAKGDLRWPPRTNERSLDAPMPNECPIANRLVTPRAQALAARMLRRDAAKRARAWEALEDPWVIEGSFGGGDKESSARGEHTEMPPHPWSSEGAAWLKENADVVGGAVSAVARYD